jgi:hypothetical protein
MISPITPRLFVPHTALLPILIDYPGRCTVHYIHSPAPEARNEQSRLLTRTVVSHCSPHSVPLITLLICIHVVRV